MKQSNEPVKKEDQDLEQFKINRKESDINQQDQDDDLDDDETESSQAY